MRIKPPQPEQQQVTDAHDPDELARLGDRQMADTPTRHHFHGVGDQIGCGRSDHISGRAIADKLVQEVFALLADPLQQISLGQDAFDPTAITRCNNCTDIHVVHESEGFADLGAPVRS